MKLLAKYHMFYTVYKTTNQVNGKIYVGVHMTNDLADAYLGSGIQLRNAVKKYGAENFKREFIKICDSSEEMHQIEASIVTEEFVSRTDTYNMKTGGIGSWSHINTNKSAHSASSRKGGLNSGYRKDNPFNDPEWQRVHNSMYNPEIVKRISAAGNSPASIEKKKATFKEIGHQKGNKNSQYGSCWVTHSTLVNKKIKKEELDKFLYFGYTKGRRMVVN